MTSPTTSPRNSPPRRGGRGGFTLVELLLVMTLLIVVISLGAPQLKRFIHGRTIDSEARRFLALTHAGQSRAVSEGIPMRLWIDARNGQYGLESESGFSTTTAVAANTKEDERALEFTIDANLQLEVIENNYIPPRPTTTASRSGVVTPIRKNVQRNMQEIRFQPDGTFDETSPQAVRIVGKDDESIWIAQSLNRLNYEIRHQPNLPDSLVP